MMTKTKMLAVLLTLAAGAAGAQQVYRCGSSYSQQPCPGGATLQVDDRRTPAEVQRANAETQRQAKAADAMEKSRLQAEAKADQARQAPQVKQATAEAKARPADKKADAKDKGKVKKPEIFTAVAPKKPGEGPDKKKSAKTGQSV
jgi:hypothetical protein